MAFTSLLSALSNFQSLKAFVEGDGLADALFRIGETAAIEALRKASISRNREAHILSAVNHLEGAEAALRNSITSARGKLLVAKNIMKSNERLTHWKQIVFLMSMCYVYLSDKEAAQDAYRRLEEGIIPKGPAFTLAVMVGLVNPILPYEVIVKISRRVILREQFFDAKLPMK